AGLVTADRTPRRVQELEQTVGRRRRVLCVRPPAGLPCDEPVEVAELVTPAHLLKHLLGHLLDRAVSHVGEVTGASSLAVLLRLLNEALLGLLHDALAKISCDASWEVLGVLGIDLAVELLSGLSVRRLDVRPWRDLGLIQ